MRILLIRLGALGDIVHAIPVAAALRRAFPEAQIDWLVGARYRELLDLVPVLDERIVVQDRYGPSLLAAVVELRRARYDVALDLQGLIKSAAIARSSGAVRVVGFVTRYLREPLARLCYTEMCDPGGEGLFDPRDTRHVVEFNLTMLKALGVENGPAKFPITHVESDVAGFVRTAAGGRYALLNPGAAWPNKRWPPDRFAAVASGLESRCGLRSVVLWGPGERDLGEEVAARAKGAAIVSPPTSIRDLVAIARGAAVMVSGDTGPMHIAAAVGTPVVGIYGPTRPERNGPWGPEDMVVSRATTCECHHLRSCRRQTMCLLEIGADEVLAAAELRLARERTRV